MFSYLENASFDSKKFFFGIVIGIISLAPFLFISFLQQSDSPYLNIFQNIEKYSFLSFSVSYIFTLSFFFFSIFFFYLIFIRQKKLYSQAGKISIGLLLIMGLFSIIFYSNSQYEYLGMTSLFSILLLYLLMAFLEEISKHFGTISLGIKEMSRSSFVLLSIFIALGFSFIENIIYLTGLDGAQGQSLGIVFFYRSVYSIIVHIFCSSFLALFFYQAFQNFESWQRLGKYLLTYIFGVLGASLLHSGYNISIEYDIGFVFPLYLLAGYFFVSSLFYYRS